MAWRKTCPTCGFDNPPDLLMCDRCLGDISGVAPTERGGPAAPPAPAATLLFPDGTPLPLAPGDEIGRDGAGAERFAGIETVSRRHARLVLHEGRPALVDLGSTNGTWLDGVRLAPNAPAPLADGQELRLSSRVTLRVRIEG